MQLLAKFPFFPNLLAIIFHHASQRIVVDALHFRLPLRQWLTILKLSFLILIRTRTLLFFRHQVRVAI